MAKSNTLYQFVNMDDKKFKNFKEIKKRQEPLRKKQINWKFSSGVSKPLARLTEDSIDKGKITKFASLMPAIASSKEVDLDELLRQMNRHTQVQLSISSKYPPSPPNP